MITSINSSFQRYLQRICNKKKYFIYRIILFHICIHFSDGFTKDDDNCHQNRTHINDYPECHFLKSGHLICFNGLKDEWKAE